MRYFLIFLFMLCSCGSASLNILGKGVGRVDYEITDFRKLNEANRNKAMELIGEFCEGHGAIYASDEIVYKNFKIEYPDLFIGFNAPLPFRSIYFVCDY